MVNLEFLEGGDATAVVILSVPFSFLFFLSVALPDLCF